MANKKPSAPRTLAERVRYLGQAAALAEGRSPQHAVDEAKRLVSQVDRRLTFSGEYTVIAILGATGSGKSSVFNAVSGTQLAQTGIHRPTTAQAMAGVWLDPAKQTPMPEKLLEWLQVPSRHQLAEPHDLHGLVLIDSPDHDSVVQQHRVDVDRLVEEADGTIWVLDPQKYADNALHSRYLKPMSRYADVMAVVLNQIDLLTPEQRVAAIADLRGLLDSEGLGATPIIAASALTGEGIDKLRGYITDVVKAKRLAAARLSAHLNQAIAGLSGELRRDRVRMLDKEDTQNLNDQLSALAGVNEITAAVQTSTLLRGRQATGWPIVSWINRYRSDPLRRLRLPGMGASASRPTDSDPIRISRATLSANTSVREARLDTAVRELADHASQGLPSGWAQAVRAASLENQNQLNGALDHAVASVELPVTKEPLWWKVVRIAQWVFLGAVVVGLVWLIVGGLASGSALALSAAPHVLGLGLPVLLLILGLVLGIGTGLVSSRFGVKLSARRRAAQCATLLNTAVAHVAAAQVITPVQTELNRYAQFVAAAALAM
jgi:putative protein kinase ArgK-like GTPase of G3E family